MDKNLHRRKLQDLIELPKEEALHGLYDRMITMPITAITNLKNELAVTVGGDRAKGIAIRYGWHNGVSDASKVGAFQSLNVSELIHAGPKLHMLHGYVHNVIVTTIEFSSDEELERIHVTWENSFEVNEFLEGEVISDKPVCHIMCGYASGYLSTVLETPILVKESNCMAMGHEQCEVICVPIDNWDEELESEYKYYQSSSMIEELDAMTDKYKRQHDTLNKAFKIHQRLFEELLSNRDLQRIVNLLHKTMGFPTFIENERNQIMIKSSHTSLDIDFKNLNTNKAHYFEVSSNLGLLRTPIRFNQEIKGYCSFVYEDGKVPNDLDYMIIDQASLIASVILLNEHVKISTEQNIKRNFLRDVLENKLDQEEVYKMAPLHGLNPNHDFWLLTIEANVNHLESNPQIEFNEELINHINKFFSNRNINAIVTQLSGKTVLLIDNPSFEAQFMKQSKFISQLQKHCSRRFKEVTFLFGVSTVADKIDFVPELYPETLAALKAKNQSNKIYYFEDLGIESVLFQIPDESLIDRFVEKQVGALLEADKNHELIKTLYAYVDNGMNINHTAAAIAMSISGLRYRLFKISEILNIDLDDTKSVFSVYMALNVLKAKGKITT